MEWKGIRFYKVEAESKSDENFTSISMNLDVNDMKLKGDELTIDFAYSVDYKPSVASLKFKGVVVLGGARADLEKVEKEWKKQKTIPKNVAEPLINVITFNAESNSVLVAKAISIVPPLLAPKIEIGITQR